MNIKSIYSIYQQLFHFLSMLVDSAFEFVSYCVTINKALGKKSRITPEIKKIKMKEL